MMIQIASEEICISKDKIRFPFWVAWGLALLSPQGFSPITRPPHCVPPSRTCRQNARFTFGRRVTDRDTKNKRGLEVYILWEAASARSRPYWLVSRLTDDCQTGWLDDWQTWSWNQNSFIRNWFLSQNTLAYKLKFPFPFFACNFVCCFVWIKNLVSHRKQHVDGVSERCVEGSMWT